LRLRTVSKRYRKKNSLTARAEKESTHFRQPTTEHRTTAQFFELYKKLFFVYVAVKKNRLGDFLDNYTKQFFLYIHFSSK
jgi:hypothetical protein